MPNPTAPTATESHAALEMAQALETLLTALARQYGRLSDASETAYHKADSALDTYRAAAQLPARTQPALAI